MTLKEAVKENGFESEAEFFLLVSNFPLSKPGMLALFDTWKNEDGSKNGLLKLYKRAGVEPP